MSNMDNNHKDFNAMDIYFTDTLFSMCNVFFNVKTKVCLQGTIAITVDNKSRYVICINENRDKAKIKDGKVDFIFSEEVEQVGTSNQKVPESLNKVSTVQSVSGNKNETETQNLPSTIESDDVVFRQPWGIPKIKNSGFDKTTKEGKKKAESTSEQTNSEADTQILHVNKSVSNNVNLPNDMETQIFDNNVNIDRTIPATAVCPDNEAETLIFNTNITTHENEDETQLPGFDETVPCTIQNEIETQLFAKGLVPSTATSQSEVQTQVFDKVPSKVKQKNVVETQVYDKRGPNTATRGDVESNTQIFNRVANEVTSQSGTQTKTSTTEKEAETQLFDDRVTHLTRNENQIYDKSMPNLTVIQDGTQTFRNSDNSMPNIETCQNEMQSQTQIFDTRLSNVFTIQNEPGTPTINNSTPICTVVPQNETPSQTQIFDKRVPNVPSPEQTQIFVKNTDRHQVESIAESENSDKTVPGENQITHYEDETQVFNVTAKISTEKTLVEDGYMSDNDIFSDNAQEQVDIESLDIDALMDCSQENESSENLAEDEEAKSNIDGANCLISGNNDNEKQQELCSKQKDVSNSTNQNNVNYTNCKSKSKDEDEPDNDDSSNDSFSNALTQAITRINKTVNGSVLSLNSSSDDDFAQQNTQAFRLPRALSQKKRSSFDIKTEAPSNETAVKALGELYAVNNDVQTFKFVHVKKEIDEKNHDQSESDDDDLSQSMLGSSNQVTQNSESINRSPHTLKNTKNISPTNRSLKHSVTSKNLSPKNTSSKDPVNTISMEPVNSSSKDSVNTISKDPANTKDGEMLKKVSSDNQTSDHDVEIPTKTTSAEQISSNSNSMNPHTNNTTVSVPVTTSKDLDPSESTFAFKQRATNSTIEPSTSGLTSHVKSSKRKSSPNFMSDSASDDDDDSDSLPPLDKILSDNNFFQSNNETGNTFENESNLLSNMSEIAPTKHRNDKPSAKAIVTKRYVDSDDTTESESEDNTKSSTLSTSSEKDQEKKQHPVVPNHVLIIREPGKTFLKNSISQISKKITPSKKSPKRKTPSKTSPTKESSKHPKKKSSPEKKTPPPKSPQKPMFRARRRKACGTCGPCKVRRDCGKCINCLNKNLKQKCKERKCLKLKKVQTTSHSSFGGANNRKEEKSNVTSQRDTTKQVTKLVIDVRQETNSKNVQAQSKNKDKDDNVTDSKATGKTKHSTSDDISFNKSKNEPSRQLTISNWCSPYKGEKRKRLSLSQGTKQSPKVQVTNISSTAVNSGNNSSDSRLQSRGKIVIKKLDLGSDSE